VTSIDREERNQSQGELPAIERILFD